MSQEQPLRPQANQEHEQEPIKYGDVFKVSSDIDASIMQKGEPAVADLNKQRGAVGRDDLGDQGRLGRVRRSGPASVMHSLANLNKQRVAAVGRNDKVPGGAVEVPGAGSLNQKQ